MKTTPCEFHIYVPDTLKWTSKVFILTTNHLDKPSAITDVLYE